MSRATSGSRRFVYDAGQRLTQSRPPTAARPARRSSPAYTPNNQISTQSAARDATGGQYHVSYDAGTGETTITDYWRFARADRRGDMSYSYDHASRLTTMVDAEGTYTYTYDNSNELTSGGKGERRSNRMRTI